MKKPTCCMGTRLVRRGSVLAVFMLLLISAGAWAQSASEVDAGIRALENMQSSFRAVTKRVLPSVAAIDVVDVVKRPVQRFDSPFDFFFGPRNRNQSESQGEREFRRQGLGSGVIVQRAGNKVYVLSNDHVVGDADEINVTLHDGRRFKADLVGKDDKRDLALVMFETGDSVPVAELGDSDLLQVGDWALAVGNPFGFQSTVTAGIISAVGRQSAPGARVGGYTDYIQTDAAINQGNSGGALVNIHGEVVGINTWIASPSGGNIGLGFAIPVNNAKKVISDFINKGKVEYGWLGITVGDLQSQVADDFGLENSEGAFVYGVFRGSPAQKGGLEPGDYITAIDGERIRDSGHLLGVVGNLRPGRTVRFDLLRTGEKAAISVTIEERADEKEINESRAKIWPGLSVVRISEAIRKQLSLPRSAGQVIVGMVDRGSPSESAGFKPGDIINKLNGKTIQSVRDFYRILNDDSGKEILFSVFRSGNEISIGLAR